MGRAAVFGHVIGRNCPFFQGLGKHFAVNWIIMRLNWIIMFDLGRGSKVYKSRQNLEPRDVCEGREQLVVSGPFTVGSQ